MQNWLRWKSLIGCLVATLLGGSLAQADVSVSAIFADHMVLQRDHANPVWGHAEPGEKVTVSIADQKHEATADDDGHWRVTLDAMTVGKPLTMVIEGKNRIEISDVLIGEVWLCSGQSNMQWSVRMTNNADLEQLTANYPNIRLITVPNVGSQEPQEDFKGQWVACSSETVGTFSAVGYYFGRQLHQSLGVPIGLINNAWGGSSCEAWVDVERLKADEQFAPLLQRWSQQEKQLEELTEQAKDDPEKKKQLAKLQGTMRGQHRPANLYCGVLNPVIGYGIRGAIWYQGESNASRAYQYRTLFPMMIQAWRDDWKQGDFPFYWVQLADFTNEVSEPGDSDWAELREAQTMTMDKLSNTGEAVIIDLGEGRDIHPRNKQDVAKRLSRWPLAKEYGLDIEYQSPRFKEMKVEQGKAMLTIDFAGKEGLYTFDVPTVLGFTIAGEDKKFVNANAKLVGKDKIEVWSDEVSEPVAVRYAWANNPIANVVTRSTGMPLTPFRTDDWEGVTAKNQ